MTNQQQVEAWHAEWLASVDPHWGDSIEWATADEIARKLDAVANEGPPEACLRAPEGHYCAEEAGHSGDCRVFPCSELEA